MQGFYFALLQYIPIQAFTALFVPSMQLYSQRRKTAHRALQWRFMRLSPPILKRYQTETIDYNATCATLDRITAPGSPPAHTRYHHHARALHRSAQTTYYNKAYKMVQQIASHASPAESARTIFGLLASANTLSVVQTRRTR